MKQPFSNTYIKVTWAANVRRGQLPRPRDCGPPLTVPASGARGLGRDPGRGSKGTILKLLLMFINRVLPRMKLADHKTQFGKENTCVLSQGGEA